MVIFQDNPKGNTDFQANIFQFIIIYARKHVDKTVGSRDCEFLSLMTLRSCDQFWARKLWTSVILLSFSFKSPDFSFSLQIRVFHNNGWRSEERGATRGTGYTWCTSTSVPWTSIRYLTLPSTAGTTLPGPHQHLPSTPGRCYIPSTGCDIPTRRRGWVPVPSKRRCVLPTPWVPPGGVPSGLWTTGIPTSSHSGIPSSRRVPGHGSWGIPRRCRREVRPCSRGIPGGDVTARCRGRGGSHGDGAQAGDVPGPLGHHVPVL